MSLSDNAVCKRAVRRGYKAKRAQGLISLWDRSGRQVLKDATADAVDTWLRDANKREARAWPKQAEGGN